MQSAQNNRERVFSELERLDRRLRPFIVYQMRDMYGAFWQQEAQKSLRRLRWTRRGDLHFDTPALLYILRDQWERIFRQALGSAERETIAELLGVRNKSAHQEAITDSDVDRLLKNVEHILSWIDSQGLSSRPAYPQTNIPRSHPTPVGQIPPDWQAWQLPPLPTRTSKVSRRTLLLIAVGVVAIGGSLCVCPQLLRGLYTTDNSGQPDQSTTGQQPTTTTLNQPLFTYTGHAQAVNAVSWSPEGQRIASGSDDTTVQIWNANNGTPLFVYHGNTDVVNAVAWSPNGQRIASGSGAWESGSPIAQVWNASDGSHPITYAGHSGSGGVTAVAWSPDGQRFASGSDADDTVQVWNANNGTRLFTYTKHTDAVNAVAWSPDGQRIASGSDDDTVQVWNASDGGQVFAYRGHTDSVSAVAWSPDGRWIASGSSDSTVQVWNASDGTHRLTYSGNTDGVTAMAWSPDGRWIASSSGADDTVQVWRASDGTQTVTYTGHSQSVTSITWSPDSQRIASASEDNTVQVWQAV